MATIHPEQNLITKAQDNKRASRRAKSFQAAYFAQSGGSRPETEGMQQLRHLCGSLAAPGGAAALLTGLQGDSTVSTFEFLNSGTVTRLKSYLLGAYHGSEILLLGRRGAPTALACGKSEL